MTENISPVTEAEAVTVNGPAPGDVEKKTLKRCFSFCGWAVVITTATMFGISLFMGILFAVLDLLGIYYMGFYTEYLLFINEAVIAAAVAMGMIILLFLPKQAPEKGKMSVKMFLTLLCVSYLIGTVGNFISNFGLTFWNLFTGNEVTNTLSDVLMSISPCQMAICTGVLAPIIEEFFFRKLLIDRMYPHGELISIIMSAILFGLFHQNFSQFFYAFGIGVVLGYLYCRTGSYVKVTLLHMAFNFIGGVIPSILSLDLIGFFNVLDDYMNTMDLDAFAAQMPALFSEYAIPLVGYMLFSIVAMVMNVAGIILLALNFKKIYIKKNASALTNAEKFKYAFVNVGMLAACILLGLIMLSTLFTI